jgi:hypothetical protein
MLTGGKRGEGRRKIYSLLYPCMTAPECNSRCWLMKSEREKEKRKVAFSSFRERKMRIF